MPAAHLYQGAIMASPGNVKRSGEKHANALKPGKAVQATPKALTVVEPSSAAATVGAAVSVALVLAELR